MIHFIVASASSSGPCPRQSSGLAAHSFWPNMVISLSETLKYQSVHKCRYYEIIHINRELWHFPFVFIAKWYHQIDEEIKLRYVSTWISKRLANIWYRVIFCLNLHIDSVSYFWHVCMYSCVKTDLKRITCRLDATRMLRLDCVIDFVTVTSAESYLFYKINKSVI